MAVPLRDVTVAVSLAFFLTCILSGCGGGSGNSGDKEGTNTTTTAAPAPAPPPSPSVPSPPSPSPIPGLPIPIQPLPPNCIEDTEKARGYAEIAIGAGPACLAGGAVDCEVVCENYDKIELLVKKEENNNCPSVAQIRDNLPPFVKETCANACALKVQQTVGSGLANASVQFQVCAVRLPPQGDAVVCPEACEALGMANASVEKITDCKAEKEAALARIASLNPLYCADSGPIPDVPNTTCAQLVTEATQPYTVKASLEYSACMQEQKLQCEESCNTSSPLLAVLNATAAVCPAEADTAKPGLEAQIEAFCGNVTATCAFAVANGITPYLVELNNKSSQCVLNPPEPCPAVCPTITNLTEEVKEPQYQGPECQAVVQASVGGWLLAAPILCEGAVPQPPIPPQCTTTVTPVATIINGLNQQALTCPGLGQGNPACPALCPDLDKLSKEIQDPKYKDCKQVVDAMASPWLQLKPQVCPRKVEQAYSTKWTVV